MLAALNANNNMNIGKT